MLGIDLSTLSRPELQRLLKVAHDRGDGPLTERLEWELESRSKGVGRRIPSFTAARPLEDDDDEEGPGEDLGEAAVDVIEPDAEPFARAPIALEPMASQPASTRSRLALAALGLVAGCLISGGVFWGLGRMNKSPAPPRPEPAVAAPEAAPAVPAAKPPVEVATAAAAPKARMAESKDAAQPPSPPAARLADTRETARSPGRNGACARSSPADRLVCHDLSLQLFDLQLQEAYRRALNARVDPMIVGEGQAAWRRARDEISDPQSLARLYNQRIHDLDAATAAARESRPPG